MTATTSPLIRHFASQVSPVGRNEVPLLVSGRGSRVYDDQGNGYLDALSALFCVNVGYGEQRIVDAIAHQVAELPYATIWNTRHAPAEGLAARIATLAPVDDPRVFFTSGGSESIEAALKFVRQYHHSRGDTERRKIFSRANSYHGTTLGALSVTGVPSLQRPFVPLLPDFYRLPSVHPRETGLDEPEHSALLAERALETLNEADPRTIAAIFVEPVQNSGGCLIVDPLYYRRLRDFCTEHGILMVSDETICSWGRLGDWFGSTTMGYRPDVLTTAKAMTSSYIPMGCAIASGAVVAEIETQEGYFAHGHTFGGHPVASAAALANIDVIEQDRLLHRVRRCSTEGKLAELMAAMTTWPLAGAVRGMGYFFAIELGRTDKEVATPLSTEELAQLNDFLPQRILDAGIIARVMNRGAPILQFCPPLIFTDAEFDELADKVSTALAEAERLLLGAGVGQ